MWTVRPNGTVLAGLALLFVLSGASADVVLRPLQAKAQRGPNLIPNPGFEALTEGKPDGWQCSLSPDIAADTVAHGGKNSLRLTKPNAETRFWVSRTIALNQPKATPLVISGWSRAEDVTGTAGADYSVWVDLQYTDGTPLYGQRVLFEVGTHDWQYAELPFVVTKPVKSATVSVLFRGSSTGTAWFDDLSLQEMQVAGGATFDGVPAVIPPARGAGEARQYTAFEVGTAAADGLRLRIDKQGRIDGLTANGKPAQGAAPGGLWLRDVAADGPWQRPECAVTRDATGLSAQSVTSTGGLNLTARYEPNATGIDVHATIQDTTGRDRAVTAYFVLPLAARKWVWHDDIVRSSPTIPGTEYKNAQSWPATGMSSAYPFCSLTAEDIGLSLAVPMDCPRVCRFVYNSSINALFVAFDLGLAKDTRNFPSRADFRFSIYQHAPEWGFRAAAQKYHERYPQSFQQRLKRGGIWMAFADISKVRDFEDFGFAYDEISATPAKFDNEHDIATFSYVEPMTYHLGMDRKYPRTYEGVMQALAADEASGKPYQVEMAQIARRCGAFTKAGKLDLIMENESWCDGAVFTLNPDPNIAEDAACPVNKGHLGYTKGWADKNLLKKDKGSIDGIYVDSMPNWGEVRNWRREHWATVGVPLTFDPETKQPVLLQIFSTWEYSKWIADDVHARGGVMHGNGGTLWPYFPGLLEITGQETGGVLGDAAMAQARTLLRNKPYSPLMNTRFDSLGQDVVVDYFNKSLLYGIFPSFFNGSYMKDGKWVTVHYFENPTFYERDRPLFRQYIPILRRMFAAGWEPITYARSASGDIRIERYGSGDRGEVLFAVYNGGKAPVTTDLVLSAAALKLPADATASALVAATPLVLSRTANGSQVALTVPAERCEVVRIGK